MPDTCWKPLETVCVIDHVESQKGPEGLYMTQRKDAIDDLKTTLDLRCPENGKLVDQIANKLGKINGRWTKPGGWMASPGDLYLSGWGAMQDKYSRDNILGQADSTGPSGDANKQLGLALFSTRSKRQRDTAMDLVTGRSKTAKLHKDTKEAVPSRTIPTTTNQGRALTGAVNLDSGVIPATSSFVTTIPNPRSQPQSPQDCSNDVMRGRLPAHSLISPCLTENTTMGDTMASYLKNPTKYLPSVSVIEDLGKAITKNIEDAVRSLLYNAYTPTDKIAQLGTLLSVEFSKSLNDLCCVVYGAATKENLVECLSRRSSHSQLGLEEFLRAAVAAAVYQWVLQEQHSPLPGDLFELSGIASIYDEVVSSVAPQLHKQILRQSKQILVNERLKLEPYIPCLTYRLVDTLAPFLRTHLAKIDEKSLIDWNNSLARIFDEALRLASQASLLETEIEYRWPKFDEKYNRTKMELNGLTTPQEDQRVKAVFFPLIQSKGASSGEPDDSSPRPILRARVQLH